MTEPISKFESKRKFELLSYECGHGLLLFRSGRSSTCPTRIDVLIKDVRAMEVRCWFAGVQIEEVGPEYLQAFKSQPRDMIEPGNRVYAIKGNGWSGFVVAGVMLTHEDEEDFMVRSKLLGPPLDE